MRLMMVNILISFLVPLLMMLVSMLINKVYFKLDVLERGLDSFNVSVFPVSLRSFMFCMISIVLDLELVLMFLCPSVVYFNPLKMSFFIFISLVFGGLMMERMFGGMSWVE